MNPPPLSNDSRPVVELEMPLPHMLIRIVRANNTFFVANRGGFKTTRGISLYCIDCVYELPRSTGVIVSPSFEHLGDNTLNPVFNALSEFGFIEGVHYVIGTRPPEEWESPYIRVQAKKYDHIISWHNGTNQYMVSMAKKGSANGISAQWGIFDEIKLMQERQLMDVIFPVFRGNEKYFSRSALFMSKFFATDKLADPAAIKWILKKRELNEPQKLDIIITLQLEVNRMKQEYGSLGVNQRKRMDIQIKAIEARLAKLRSNLTFYVEANHEHTKQILGERWYSDKEKELKPYELKVAIRNEDPDRPEDGFYPDFDIVQHGYVKSDYNPNRPLIISADYQHSVSPICVAQITKLGETTPYSLNYINEIATMAPEGLEAAVELFCTTYKTHRNKIVHYVYDQTATGKRNDARQYNEIVKTKLQEYGWWVIDVYTGQAPTHFNKYTDTKRWLKEEDPQAMPIRINQVQCKYLIISITGAPAKMKNGKTEKDKSAEQNAVLDQRETTHFSDAFDMLNHAVLKLNRITSLDWTGAGIAFR